MNKACWAGAMAGLWLAAMPAMSAEMGRKPLGGGAEGGAGIETTKTYNDIFAEGIAGADLFLAWNNAQWKETGDGVSHSDKVWIPQVSLFYGMSKNLDIRLCGKWFSLQDDEAELDIVRVGFGVKFWGSTGTDFKPYVGALLNYYSLDSNAMDDEDGAFGLSGEAGVAYQVSDFLFISLGVQGETLLGKTKGDIAGESERLSFNALGLGLGAAVVF